MNCFDVPKRFHHLTTTVQIYVEGLRKATRACKKSPQHKWLMSETAKSSLRQICNRHCWCYRFSLCSRCTARLPHLRNHTAIKEEGVSFGTPSSFYLQFANVSPSALASTTISRVRSISIPSILVDSTLSSKFCMARFTGRAPNSGS